ncbi:MAG: ATP-binding protein [Gemmataceae bacterium]|nr:ATP-binding protein [Gemmataceae bacterium]
MTPANPFAAYSSIAVGPAFFGRRDELALVRSRLLDGSDPGNLPVVGMPRVGKSSLVHQAAAVLRDEFAARKIVFADLGLGIYQSARQFFQGLTKRVYEQVRRARPDTRSVDDQFRKVAGAAGRDGVEFYDEMYDFFARVREAGARVVAFVDEFDSVPEVFRSVDEFQVLRELGQHPDRRVALVTASRRPIEVLERKGHSTLASAMGQVLYLTPFPDREAGEFYDRCGAAGLPLAPADRDAARRATGYQPYLLCMLGNNLVRDRQVKGAVDIPAVCRDTAEAIVTHYQEVIRVLRDADPYAPLLKLLFGPVFNVTQDQVNSLRRYHLLVRDGDGYRAFSDHFHEYLRTQLQAVDYWPLWQETEQAVRELAGAYLAGEYGAGWQAAVPDKATRLVREKAKAWRALRDEEVRRYQDRASPSLLDYSYA